MDRDLDVITGNSRRDVEDENEESKRREGKVREGKGMREYLMQKKVC